MSENSIKFKRVKKKPSRKPLEADEDEKLDEVSTKISEMREIQELRKRPNGISVVGLALGKKVTLEEEIVNKDPFKVKSGGMINMQSLKSGKLKQVDDAYDTGIGTQFSVETNKRDEDEEMMKFIEEQLKREKGKSGKFQESEESKISVVVNKYITPEEAALQAVPTHLRESTAKRSEEMLSNQMLSGIPEIDLGIEVKIRNIEATEEAKLKLLAENQRKKDGPSQFVPTNIAVNFIELNKRDDKKKTDKKPEESSAKRKGENEEKATDNYHFEKFKKQFRRH